MQAPTLETLIRRKLAIGALPDESPIEILNGPGTGQACSACAALVLPAEDEYLCRFIRERPLRLHLACFVEWRRQTAGEEHLR